MKTLSELTYEELAKVYDSNEKVQYNTYSHLYDIAMDDCMEIIGYWPSAAIDYEIGYGRGTFFMWLDESGFIKGLQKVQENFGLLPSEHNFTIEKCALLISRLDKISECDDKNFDRLTKRIDELATELADACYNEFTNRFEISDEDCKAFFCECEADDMAAADDYYIDDDYILYRDVTECYA